MSELVKTWTDWLINSRFSYMNETQKQQTLLWLLKVRDKILERAGLQPGDTVIDVGSGTGLLAFGAQMILNGNGKVIVSDAFADCVDACKAIAEHCGVEKAMDFLQTDATDIKLSENSVDVVVMRSVLVHILEKPKAINEFYRILKPGGRISVFEPIIRKNTHYYELVDSASFPNYEKIKDAEQKMVFDDNDALLNFDEDSLKNDFLQAGFKNIDVLVSVESSTYEAKAEMIDPWFNAPPSPGKPALKERFKQFMPKNEVLDFIEALKTELNGKNITINSPVAYIYAEK